MLNRGIYGLLALLTLLGLLMNAATVAVFSTDPFTPTPALPLRVIESESPLVHASGSWTAQNTANASGGSYLYSSGATTDVLEVYFIGTRVEVVYLQHPALGTFAIEIDTVVVRTVVATGETTMFGVRSVVDYLTDEPHILRVYPVSGVIAIDAFYAIPLLPAMDMFPEDGSAGGSALFSIDVKPIAFRCGTNSHICIAPTNDPLGTETLSYLDDAKSPTWSPQGDTILFAVDNKLHLLEYDASTWAERLTAPWPYDLEMAHNLVSPDALDWSPVNDYIAFSALEFGQTNRSLYCLDLSNRDAPTTCITDIQIVPSASGADDDHPSWSPDGQQIAFETNRHKPGSVDKSIYLYHLVSSTDPTEFVAPGSTPYESYEDPAWSAASPDGQSKIAVAYYPGGTEFENSTDQIGDVSHIRVFEVDDPATAFTVTGTSYVTRFVNPTWSPVNDKIIAEFYIFLCVEGCPTGTWDASPHILAIFNLNFASVEGSLPGREPDILPELCSEDESYPVWLKSERDYPGRPMWADRSVEIGLIADENEGLYVYESPIINAPVLGGLSSPNTIPWGNGICVTGRLKHHWQETNSAGDIVTPNEYQEVWYEIEVTNNVAWIPARIGDIIYIQEWSDPSIDDPLAAYLASPDNIRFRYDRLAASRYARENSYNNFEDMNDLIAILSDSGDYIRVTIDDTLFVGYNSLATDSTATGSANFISQALWHGGLPMVYTQNGNHTPSCSGENDHVHFEYGWRYCTEPNVSLLLGTNIPLRLASTKWRWHKGIRGYLANLVGSESDVGARIKGLTGVGDYISTSQDAYAIPSIIQEIANPTTCPHCQNDDPTICLRDTYSLSFYNESWRINCPNSFAYFEEQFREFLHIGLRNDRATSKNPNPVPYPLELGDYLFVDSNVDGSTADHGFMVVGWGRPLLCQETYDNRDDLTHKVVNNLAPNEYGISVTWSATMYVPYVADFVLDKDNMWLQYPGARPFYCILADNMGKVQDKSYGVHFNGVTEYAFYHVTGEFDLPSMGNLSATRIYPPNFDNQLP